MKVQDFALGSLFQTKSHYYLVRLAKISFAMAVEYGPHIVRGVSNFLGELRYRLAPLFKVVPHLFWGLCFHSELL